VDYSSSGSRRGVRPRRVAVIGVGNPLFGDDGAGYCLVKALISCGASGPDFKALDRIGPGDLSILDGYDYAIFIDAYPARQSSGQGLAVIEFDSSRLDELEAATSISMLDPHGIGPLELVVLARSAGVFSGSGVVVAVPAYNLEFASGLSRPTRESLLKALEAIVERLRGLSQAIHVDRECVSRWINDNCERPLID